MQPPSIKRQHKLAKKQGQADRSAQFHAEVEEMKAAVKESLDALPNDIIEDILHLLESPYKRKLVF